ncbi:MAG: hypothetical protein ACN6O7_00190 [Sphingobacterium sp.]
MIVVKVTYSVHDDYIHTNKKMIESFLEDFKRLDGTQFLYTILQSGESNSFVHISQYQNKEIQDQLLNIPSFLKFQEQRDKNLATEPKIELMSFIGSSKDPF